MNNNRVGYRFAILGLVSLAFGIACVGWAPLLGGFSFVGATASVFLAMLSFSKLAALRRLLPDAPSTPIPEAKRESVRAPIVPRQRREVDDQVNDDNDDEEAELAARLAALRAAVQGPSEHRPAPREPEQAHGEEQAPDAGITVIEETPLEPDLATLFEAPAVEAPPAPTTPASGMRQMDDLRAELARLRENARMRQAATPVSVAPPNFLEAPSHASAAPSASDAALHAPELFARTEFSGLPGERPAQSSLQEEEFPRTEFAGLRAPSPSRT